MPPPPYVIRMLRSKDIVKLRAEFRLKYLIFISINCDHYLHDYEKPSHYSVSTTIIYLEVSKTYRPAISPLCILS
jgi:hypothetical protein